MHSKEKHMNKFEFFSLIQIFDDNFDFFFNIGKNYPLKGHFKTNS